MFTQQGIAQPQAVCPVCNGTCRVPPTERQQAYKKSVYNYDAETDTFPCQNCGGQRQWGVATGQVRLNKEGQPCTHKYKSHNIGRCLTQYVCEHCGDSYSIDSGD